MTTENEQKTETLEQLEDIARRMKAGDPPAVSRRFTIDEQRALKAVQAAGYTQADAVSILEEHGASAILAAVQAPAEQIPPPGMSLEDSHPWMLQEAAPEAVLEDDGTPPPGTIDPADLDHAPDHFHFGETHDPRKVLLAPHSFRVDLDEDGNPHHHPDKVAAGGGRRPHDKKTGFIDPARVAAAKARLPKSRA